MPKADQSRLLNVYLRPWTTAGEDASFHVSHVAALDVPISDMQKRPTTRVGNKTQCGRRCHAAAWRDYISKHIVSRPAKRAIRNFLAAVRCTPDEADEPDAADADLPRPDVDTSWVDASTVRRLTVGEGFQYSKRSKQTVQSIVEHWNPSDSHTVGDQPLQRCAGIPDPGPPPSVPPDHKHGRSGPQPLHVDVHYTGFDSDVAQSWLRGLHTSTTNPVPSAEQSAVLQAVIDRCRTEMLEEQQEAPCRSEPLRALLHGVPGAGKSETLHWLRQLFEAVCGWEHLHLFAFVAPQNTQAGLIDGVTLHSFADIKVHRPGEKRRATSGHWAGQLSDDFADARRQQRRRAGLRATHIACHGLQT